MSIVRSAFLGSFNWNPEDLTGSSHLAQQVPKRSLLIRAECGEEQLIVAIGDVGQLREHPSALCGQGEELDAVVERTDRACDQLLRAELVENLRDGPAGHPHCRGECGGGQAGCGCELIECHPFRNRDVALAQRALEGVRNLIGYESQPVSEMRFQGRRGRSGRWRRVGWMVSYSFHGT